MRKSQPVGKRATNIKVDMLKAARSTVAGNIALFAEETFSAQPLRTVMPLKNGIHPRIVEIREDGFRPSPE
ncbi:MAG: hypothetical protein GX556_07760 [Fibrobacter sp.]|nr:hypothetical protein [Fibrobacter sp.]